MSTLSITESRSIRLKRLDRITTDLQAGFLGPKEIPLNYLVTMGRPFGKPVLVTRASLRADLNGDAGETFQGWFMQRSNYGANAGAGRDNAHSFANANNPNGNFMNVLARRGIMDARLAKFSLQFDF